MKDKSGPAFPTKEPLSSDILGMSIRDYFAAKIIGGILADSTVRMDGIDRKKALAELAYEMADAMISARCSD